MKQYARSLLRREVRHVTFACTFQFYIARGGNYAQGLSRGVDGMYRNSVFPWILYPYGMLKSYKKMGIFFHSPSNYCEMSVIFVELLIRCRRK